MQKLFTMWVKIESRMCHSEQGLIYLHHPHCELFSQYKPTGYQ